MHRQKRSSGPLTLWIKALLSALLLGAACPGVGAPVVLTLSNGDRVTGEVISADAAVIKLQTTLLGVVQIDKTNVARQELLSTVVGPGTNAPATTNSAARHAADTPPAADSIPGWRLPWIGRYGTNWHGSVQLGMTLGFGTTDQRTFYSNLTLNHQFDRIHDLIEYHVAYGIVNNVESANRMDGAWKMDLDLGQTRRTYIYNQVGGGYDVISQINLQYHEGVGIGYKVITKKLFQLNVEGGADYQHYDYLDASSKELVSARISENLTWKPVDKLIVTERLSFLPDVLNVNEYRVQLDITAAYPVLKRVTLNLNLRDLYESEPAQTVHRNDLQIQTTVGYTF